VIPDALALPVLERLRDALTVELAQTLAGLPSRVSLVPGANLVLDCDKGWVRLNAAAPSVRWPNFGGSLNSCADPTAVQVQVGVARCVITMDADGRPPTAEEDDESVRVQLSDYAALRRTVLCSLPGKDYVLGTYLPVGPQGGLSGGALMVTVRSL
jgi:hypothetical protein